MVELLNGPCCCFPASSRSYKGINSETPNGHFLAVHNPNKQIQMKWTNPLAFHQPTRPVSSSLGQCRFSGRQPHQPLRMLDLAQLSHNSLLVLLCRICSSHSTSGGCPTKCNRRNARGRSIGSEDWKPASSGHRKATASGSDRSACEGISRGCEGEESRWQ